MSEFEEKLNAILSDPAEMERISRMAAQLMGETPAAAQPQDEGEMLTKLKGILAGAGPGGDKTALLQAMAPYLRPDRRSKLQKSLRLAQMLRVARAALGDAGGDKGV